ncbi:MAG: hypothetical protein Kow00114_18810 [Kiloniellaceae bacterium]
MKPVPQNPSPRRSPAAGLKRPLRAALAGAVLLTATACAAGGSGVVYSSNFTAGYAPRSLGAAMARAPLLVETYGSPAPGQAAGEVARASALALRRHGPAWLPRNYTDSAADAGNGPYRLRIAYDLPRAFNRQEMCSAEMAPAAIDAARRDGETPSGRTLASLCRGETMIAIAEGAPSVSDIASAAFAEFVGRLGRSVMPRRNPVLDDDCLFRRCAD